LNSLKEIFLGWTNNTCATHEERLQVIDNTLIRFYPEVVWKLLISLLPNIPSETSTHISKPTYRDWAKGINKEIRKHEYYLYTESLADRLLNLVGNELGSRWVELIENICRLPQNSFCKAIDKLLSFEIDEMDDKIRLEVANKLRENISRHREFNSEEWSLPKEVVDKLEDAFNFIIPEDPIFKNRYLFDNYLPNFIDPIIRKEENIQNRKKIVEIHRQNALIDIYQKFGIDGIKQLINDCYYPDLVGSSIAKSELRNNLESELLDWLGNTNVRLISASHSFTFKCTYIDENWTKTVFEQFEQWDKYKIVNFLLGFPFDKNVLEFLNTDEEIKGMYWKKIDHYRLSNDNLELINLVVEQLLINERPLAAIEAASRVLYDINCKVTLNSSLLGDVLKKIATNPADYEQIPFQNVRDEILRSIEYIQKQEQLPREEIIQIEWTYLQVFRFESSFKPIYLEEEVITNPVFFAQIVSFVYLQDDSEKEIEMESISEDNKKHRAEMAFSLLSSISTIPGLQENGSIDAEKLREWIYNSREHFKRLGRVKIGDDQIGQILSNSPLGIDGIWPHEAVRDLIEELQSPVLEKAIEVGKYNLRGASIRLPHDGGKEERTLAREYSIQAQKIILKWPRTSRILECLEKSYKRNAEYEDRQVDLRG